jgi:hypothetical protein
MTDASLANVVFVAFAALTVRLYRPLLRKADPTPPGVRHPDTPPRTPGCARLEFTLARLRCSTT